MSWNWFECGVEIVLIYFGAVADIVNTVVCVLLMMGGDTTRNM
jgi:hypothetical protein